MVLLAFVLFTVSSLATHTKALPTDQPAVHHECGDKALCHNKPADYPQEEIDRAVLNQLPYLQRIKREIVEPMKPEYGGNCEYVYTSSTPYTVWKSDENKLPTFVIQSKWFSQNITEVQCVHNSSKSPCFSNLFLQIPGRTTQCKTKMMYSSLLVFNKITKQISKSRTEIGIDCICVIVKV